MLRIALCDDMRSFLDEAKVHIERWPDKPDDLITELFESGDALLCAHEANPFDIIFLDIVMPMINGMETAAEIRKTDRSVKIIFLTLSKEFAVDSYEVKANNYLLKPINAQKLYSCLDECYKDILNDLKYIAVKTSAAIHRIPLRNIEYIEAQGKSVLFTLTDKSIIKATDPFYIFEKKLLFSDGFFKCHRSYIVNIYRIDTYTQKEICMRSGCRIPISRSCHKEFESAYFELLFGKAGDK